MFLSPFFSFFTSPPVLFLFSRCTVISLLDKTRRLTLYLHTFSPEFFRVPFQYERLHQSCISRFLGPATRYIHLQPPNGWLLFLISLIDLFHLLPRPVRFDRLWNHRNSPSTTRWFRNASPDYRTKRRNDIVRAITRHDTCYESWFSTEYYAWVYRTTFEDQPGARTADSTATTASHRLYFIRSVDLSSLRCLLCSIFDKEVIIALCFDKEAGTIGEQVAASKKKDDKETFFVAAGPLVDCSRRGEVRAASRNN